MRVWFVSICLLTGFAELQSCKTRGRGEQQNLRGGTTITSGISKPAQPAVDATASVVIPSSPADVGSTSTMTFVKIKAGTFMMGSPDSEADRSDNERQHQVTLTKGFDLQTTNVTQLQWVSVMGSNPSNFQKSEHCPGEFTSLGNISMCPNNPVEQVSWGDAKAFIEKLNAKGDGHRYRLPTEAEWEYAARSGTIGSYAGDLDAMAWYNQNSGGIPHPVATKKANAWGVYDMYGSVWEWTADWYDSYSPSQATDPVGPAAGSDRVVRGGGFGGSAQNCRSAFRGASSPDYLDAGASLGFRLLRTSP